MSFSLHEFLVASGSKANMCPNFGLKTGRDILNKIFPQGAKHVKRRTEKYTEK
jgi:hypothetical protein